MNICALCLSWVPDGKYPCLDAQSIITLLFQRNAWSSMCGVVHLTKGIWAWGRVMETQPSTLSSYENNRLTFFEAIKHADLSLSVSKCKWGIAALAHPVPLLWMRLMVVLNIPKGISHCRVFWSQAWRPQREFTAAPWTPNRPVSCLLMFNIMTYIRAERTMGRKKV